MFVRKRREKPHCRWSRRKGMKYDSKGEARFSLTIRTIGKRPCISHSPLKRRGEGRLVIFMERSANWGGEKRKSPWNYSTSWRKNVLITFDRKVAVNHSRKRKRWKTRRKVADYRQGKMAAIQPRSKEKIGSRSSSPWGRKRNWEAKQGGGEVCTLVPLASAKKTTRPN